MKLKRIVESFSSNIEEPTALTTEEKKQILRMISEYNSLGKALSRHGDLKEIAEQMAKIAESASGLALGESQKEDWFNTKVVNENMTQLKKSCGTFNKIAQEAYGLEQQMSALYEDMGHILGRYFDIKEPITEIENINDL